MAHFNLDNYTPVEERIAMFREQHPEGRILTEMVKDEPPRVVFRAEVYRDKDDDRPTATGYAYEMEGSSPVNRTSYVENCETSAVGRALANMGYQGKREGAPRPSREEMEKVQRMGGEPMPDAPKASPSKPASDKQKGFVEQLAKSSHITDEERDSIRKRVLRGMTSADASKAIEWLTATIAERENKEPA